MAARQRRTAARDGERRGAVGVGGLNKSLGVNEERRAFERPFKHETHNDVTPLEEAASTLALERTRSVAHSGWSLAHEMKSGVRPSASAASKLAFALMRRVAHSSWPLLHATMSAVACDSL
jgi:hypothetical protein